MNFGDQMKNKADEVHLQAKAKDFGDALAAVVKAAVDAVGGYTSEHRDKITGALDKTEQVIGERTGGKHAETVSKVRSQLDKGIDKIAQQADAKPGSAQPGSGQPGNAVPDDQYSAFDEDSPTGHS